MTEDSDGTSEKPYLTTVCCNSGQTLLLLPKPKKNSLSHRAEVNYYGFKPASFKVEIVRTLNDVERFPY